MRSLFLEHLGASPAQVARTARQHLARHLCADTTLSLAAIARASGQRSARSMSVALGIRTARHVPRAQGGRSAQCVTLTLGYCPPYDWPGMLAFFRARAIPGVERVHDQVYERTFSSGTRHGRLAVTAGGGDTLELRIECADKRAVRGVVARVRRVFDLHADPLHIGAHLARDARLAPLVAARPGLRVPGDLGSIRTGAARDPRSAGQRDRGGCAGKPARGAARYAAGGVAASGRHTDARVSWSCASRCGRRNPHWHARRPRARADDDGARRARATGATAAGRRPGVGACCTGGAAGHRAVDCAVHRVAGVARAGRVSRAADVGLMRALADPDGQRPTPAELLTIAERWRPWRAYAAQHLWAVDATPAPAPAAR